MFIGIVGSNGFGVFDDRQRMNNSKEYLRRPEEKEFDSRQSAFTWAKEIYNEMQDDVDDAFYGMSFEVKLNWILFRTEIKRRNQAG